MSIRTKASISVRSWSENGNLVSGSEKSPVARIKSTSDSTLKTMADPNNCKILKYIKCKKIILASHFFVRCVTIFILVL